MMEKDRVTVDVHLDRAGTPEGMAQEIREGLTRAPKRLPSKYFYDERGCGLFERITGLPEYYLTRNEDTILRRRAAEIARLALPFELMELGAGSAGKTRTLIDAGLREGCLRRYLLFDVARDTAERAARSIAERYPDVQVRAVVADFERYLPRLPFEGRRLLAFLGSTIGNFVEDEAVAFLFRAGSLLDRGDWLLLGTDLVKHVEALEAAYNDGEGVTAEFNRNILNVINRRLDGNFKADAFEHVAFYNADASRVETYLRPRTAQRVHLDEIDLEVEFAAGEMMRTEVSCKYTRASVESILERAGLRLEHWFTDEAESFALSLSRLA